MLVTLGLHGTGRAQPHPQQALGGSQELPRVAKIVVEGQQRYTAAQLIAGLGQREGDRLDPEAIQRGIQNLWSSLRVRAEVLHREVPSGVELLLRVTEQPVDREPRFIGNVDIGDEELLEWALLEDQAELYVHQAPRVRQRLIERYLGEGFFFVEIKVVTRGGEAGEITPDVIFEINEGPRVRVDGVEIRGADSMPDSGALFWKDGLRHLAGIQLAGRRLFNWFGSKFVEEELSADIVALRQVYRDRGWLDAVVELERLDFNSDRSRVKIHIVVDEGRPYTVSSVRIEGGTWANPELGRDEEIEPSDLLFSEDELLELCDLRPGARFESSGWRHDRSALREYYGQRGYISHGSLPRRIRWMVLEPKLVYDVERHTVEVTYVIIQGERLRIREILFAGAKHTRDRVLRRELEIFPGDDADLEKIERSRRGVQNTGYFSDPRDPGGHREPTFRFIEVPGSDSMVDLEFIVEEGRVLDFNLSGGVDTNNGVFGLISVQLRNFDITNLPSSPWAFPGEIARREAFHGAGQRLDIELSPGTQLSRFRVHFQEPDIFRLHLNPISFDIDLSVRERIFDLFDEDRSIERVRFGRRFNRDTFVWAGYQLGAVEVDDLDASVPPLLVQQEAQGRQQLQGFLLDFLYRDLDNRLLPREGLQLRSNNAWYGGPAGGDLEFWQSVQRFDWYKPVNETEKGLKRVVHLELDLGFSGGYDGTDDVPYTERFFLGGRSSLRGFQFRGVGPVDPASEEPLGGESSFSGTLEFQLPLTSNTQRGTFQEVEVLRGLLFLDFGVLDPSGGLPDFEELRASAGVGFGLAAPLPLTINFGFPLRTGSGDDLRVVSLSLGVN